MIEQVLPFIGLFIGIFLLVKLNPIYIDRFLREEAKRGINDNFKSKASWNSQGKVYTEGLTLVKNRDGKIEFINQSKLADTALLHK